MLNKIKAFVSLFHLIEKLGDTQLLVHRIREYDSKSATINLNSFRDWGDGSAVKSTGCSSRGPGFKSQQPHCGSQPSVMRSKALFWSV